MQQQRMCTCAYVRRYEQTVLVMVVVLVVVHIRLPGLIQRQDIDWI